MEIKDYRGKVLSLEATVKTLRAEIEAKDAEMKRMAVELEAWRAKRLYGCGQSSFGIDGEGPFHTITAAVDQLMAEREE